MDLRCSTALSLQWVSFEHAIVQHYEVALISMPLCFKLIVMYRSFPFFACAPSDSRVDGGARRLRSCSSAGAHIYGAEALVLQRIAGGEAAISIDVEQHDHQLLGGAQKGGVPRRSKVDPGSRKSKLFQIQAICEYLVCRWCVFFAVVYILKHRARAQTPALI